MDPRARSPQDPLGALKFQDLFRNVPNLAKLCFLYGSIFSLEGPEGYLRPGIHISGIISVYGKPFTPQAFSEILA